MKTFRISNRVFWAGVVLASAGLIGRNGGQAQPPIPAEIKAHKLIIVNEKGEAAITLMAKNGGAVASVGNGGSAGVVALMTSPKNGSSIVFLNNGKGKEMRIIGAAPDKDTPHSSDAAPFIGQ